MLALPPEQSPGTSRCECMQARQPILGPSPTGWGPAPGRSAFPRGAPLPRARPESRRSFGPALACCRGPLDRCGRSERARRRCRLARTPPPRPRPRPGPSRWHAERPGSRPASGSARGANRTRSRLPGPHRVVSRMGIRLWWPKEPVLSLHGGGWEGADPPR